MPINQSQRQQAIAKRHQLVASPMLDQLRQEATVWSAVVFWDAYPG